MPLDIPGRHKDDYRTGEVASQNSRQRARCFSELYLLPWVVDYTVLNGESYCYAVTAVSNAGLESGFSNKVPFTMPRNLCLCRLL